MSVLSLITSPFWSHLRLMRCLRGVPDSIQMGLVTRKTQLMVRGCERSGAGDQLGYKKSWTVRFTGLPGWWTHRGAGGVTGLERTYPAPCISSIQLFLSCILYQKAVNVFSWALWVTVVEKLRGVVGSPKSVAKLDRSVGPGMHLAPQVRAASRDWALQSLESDANSGWLLSD